MTCLGSGVCSFLQHEVTVLFFSMSLLLGFELIETSSMEQDMYFFKLELVQVKPEKIMCFIWFAPSLYYGYLLN